MAEGPPLSEWPRGPHSKRTSHREGVDQPEFCFGSGRSGALSSCCPTLARRCISQQIRSARCRPVRSLQSSSPIAVRTQMQADSNRLRGIALSPRRRSVQETTRHGSGWQPEPWTDEPWTERNGGTFAPPPRRRSPKPCPSRSATTAGSAFTTRTMQWPGSGPSGFCGTWSGRDMC
jgi:hypothetical protein